MSTITKELTINATRETVWSHLENPDLLAAWLMRNNFSGHVGEDFQFFARPSGGFDGVISCKLTEFARPRKLAFTWNASDIGADTLVTIELFEERGATRLRLIHANWENAKFDVDKLVADHRQGWTDHLEILTFQVAEEEGGGQKAAGSPDWTQINLYVAIKAKPEAIIEMWSSVNGMEAFFVEMMRITDPHGAEREPDERAISGDKYTWRWHNGRSVSGEFLESTAGNEVRFTFGESNVSVSAIPYKEGSLVRLRQSEIPDNDDARMHIYANCRSSWVYFLTVQKVLLEHEIDGRDKTRETGASFSTYFDPAKLGIDT